MFDEKLQFEGKKKKSFNNKIQLQPLILDSEMQKILCQKKR